VSRHGKRLVYERSEDRAEIWRVGGPAASEEDAAPSLFTSSTQWESYPDYSPDGSRVLFTSNRSGFGEIWICDSEGSNPVQLTRLERPLSGYGKWSPDGKQIAFVTDRDNNVDIYVVSAAGGIPRRVTTDPSAEARPSWSRDGSWLYFSSNRSGSFEVYRMPAEGGDAVQITNNGGCFSSESVDGRFLYFSKSDEFLEGLRGIWRMPTDGGDEVTVHDRGVAGLWEVLEEGICYRHVSGVELLEFATGEVRRIAEIPKSTRLGFAVSPDARWVLYHRQESESDIMLVENFR
jgi:Tol biopolymer transport system component